MANTSLHNQSCVWSKTHSNIISTCDYVTVVAKCRISSLVYVVVAVIVEMIVT